MIKIGILKALLRKRFRLVALAGTLNITYWRFQYILSCFGNTGSEIIMYIVLGFSFLYSNGLAFWHDFF